MSGWPVVALGDVADVIAGQSPKGEFYNKTGVGTPFYQGKKDFGPRFVEPTSVWTSVSTKIALPGDILMSVRAPVGPVNLAVEECCIGRGLAAIRTFGPIDRDFLFYYFRSKRGSFAGTEGAVFDSINKAQIQQIEIPLPPLDEQKRIVAKLDKIQTEVGHMLSNLYERLQAVNSLRGAALANRLKGTKSAVTPSASEEHRGTEWPLVRLGELVSLEYGKPLPPEKRNAEGAHPVYGANGVKTLTDEYLVEGDSIIVGRKGSAGEIARVSGRWWPLDVTYYVLVKTDDLDMGYLFLVLMGLNLPSLARGVKPGINRNDVYDLMISLPDLAEQKRIVAELDELAVELDDLEAKVVAQKSLVSAFQSAALSTALAGGG